jgi:hypothetical protein
VQPAQLSLLADQIPTPTPMVLAELPEADVGGAICLLGALIAKASKHSRADEASAKKVGADE